RDTSAGATAVVALEPFSGTGDGTVPDSSGKALKVPTARIGRDSPADFFSIDHQGIYGTDTAKKIVFTTVWNLAIKGIEEQVGGPAED
ncbi:MAG TPA: alpha/beta hydrolase, partial [Geobacter anodireducens]|nr:alpha/beta hydrolase [Geobacter anodireducens]